MKYTVDQKIWQIKINKHSTSPSQYSVRQDGIKTEELKILGISPYKIVLNNDWFTTLENDDRDGYRRDLKYYTYLDEVSVNIRTNDSILGDGVFITLYSTKEPNNKILKKMVAKASTEINKKYGFLFGGIVDELYSMVENNK